MNRSSPANHLIRSLLRQYGRLTNVETLSATQDLYAAGLTSFTAVQLMLALEEAFGVEFPERMMNRRSFSSIHSIAACLAEMTSLRAAA